MDTSSSDRTGPQEPYNIPTHLRAGDILVATNLADPPHCAGMQELPEATTERAKVVSYLRRRETAHPQDGAGDLGTSSDINIQYASSDSDPTSTCSTSSEESNKFNLSPIFKHIAQGLALTTGSALGSSPPSTEQCLTAFQVPNKAQLTAGARAWAKHAHRSSQLSAHRTDSDSLEVQAAASSEVLPSVCADNDLGKANELESAQKKKRAAKETSQQHNVKASGSDGWWGRPSGPVIGINEKAVALFWKIMNSATWRNLHWLPHQVLVYEVRVAEGYGMRWSQDRGSTFKSSSCTFNESGRTRNGHDQDAAACLPNNDGNDPPWVFRGFVEPMMENGHELGWKHIP